MTQKNQSGRNIPIKTVGLVRLVGLCSFIRKVWNTTKTKFIKQKFRMLFLPHQCNSSCLAKLSRVKWIASNCGWPTSKQNRLNKLIRERLVKWRAAISLSLGRELNVAIFLSLNFPVLSVHCFASPCLNASQI